MYAWSRDGEDERRHTFYAYIVKGGIMRPRVFTSTDHPRAFALLPASGCDGVEEALHIRRERSGGDDASSPCLRLRDAVF